MRMDEAVRDLITLRLALVREVGTVGSEIVDASLAHMYIDRRDQAGGIVGDRILALSPSQGGATTAGTET